MAAMAEEIVEEMEEATAEAEAAGPAVQRAQRAAAAATHRRRHRGTSTGNRKDLRMTTAVCHIPRSLAEGCRNRTDLFYARGIQLSRMTDKCEHNGRQIP